MQVAQGDYLAEIRAGQADIKAMLGQRLPMLIKLTGDVGEIKGRASDAPTSRDFGRLEGEIAQITIPGHATNVVKGPECGSSDDKATNGLPELSRHRPPTFVVLETGNGAGGAACIVRICPIRPKFSRDILSLRSM